ncbi:MAG: hypothetical protein M3Y25_05005, partial [Thermoproteota archaeon]|nr:hypothetical protein [Thermoproteota archaeon]
ILGAGVNKEIFAKENVSPPLTNNFFNTAFRINERFNLYDKSLEPVYDFIAKYWRKQKQHLRKCSFDLEECFTLLQLQINDSIEEGNEIEYNKLNEVQSILLSFFIEVLNEFKGYIRQSEWFLKFAELLFSQKPNIITFNYDDFIETAIEYASGENPLHKYVSTPQQDLNTEDLRTVCQKSKWKWNRPLGYQIEFDKVSLHDGSEGIYEKQVPGEIFYGVNSQYPWKILKLHGSVNWYRYINDSPNQYLNDHQVDAIYQPRKDRIVLQSPVWFLPLSDLPWDRNQLFLSPIIITPVLYKHFSSDNIARKVFEPQWNKARNLLSKCKRLVIVGYSFSTTDFYSKKLLLETTSENNIEELIIINPDDEATNYTKNIVPSKKTQIFNSLREYLADISIDSK